MKAQNEQEHRHQGCKALNAKNLEEFQNLEFGKNFHCLEKLDETKRQKFRSIQLPGQFRCFGNQQILEVMNVQLLEKKGQDAN